MSRVIIDSDSRPSTYPDFVHKFQFFNFCHFLNLLFSLFVMFMLSKYLLLFQCSWRHQSCECYLDSESYITQTQSLYIQGGRIDTCILFNIIINEDSKTRYKISFVASQAISVSVWCMQAIQFFTSGCRGNWRQ